MAGRGIRQFLDVGWRVPTWPKAPEITPDPHMASGVQSDRQRAAAG
jgi:hypothetical protein